MKKLLLILFAGLLVSAAAFADHPQDKWAIGPVNGVAIGIYDYGYYTNVGVSLKAPMIPVFWGIYSNLSPWGAGAGLTGDYYIIEKNIIETEATNKDGTYDLKLDWYLGVGGFFDFFVWDWGDYTFFNAGVRVPGGVSWHIVRALELSVGIAPGLGVTNWDEKFRFHFAVPVEISFRYWIWK
jgi:hypothetical protein